MNLSIEDRLELAELYARYCHAIDANDAERVLALFAPGGGFHRVTASLAFGEPRSFAGDAALREYYTSRPSDGPASQHWVNNVWFESEGTTVTGHASFAIVRQASGRGEILTFGHYRDELVTVGGRWRFLNRFVELDFKVGRSGALPRGPAARGRATKVEA